MMHPAETYAQRLREYQWESLMLYLARSEGWSNAAIQDGVIGVLAALDRLWSAQEALHLRVLNTSTEHALINAAARRHGHQ